MKVILQLGLVAVILSACSFDQTLQIQTNTRRETSMGATRRNGFNGETQTRMSQEEVLVARILHKYKRDQAKRGIIRKSMQRALSATHVKAYDKRHIERRLKDLAKVERNEYFQLVKALNIVEGLHDMDWP
jgi:hypothetical protein